jgi:hypothetical protein
VVQTVAGIEIISENYPSRVPEEVDGELIAEALHILRTAGFRAGLTKLTPKA